MISFLTGRVASRGGGTAVIDVGGVGMTLLCTPACLAQLEVGAEATVATSLVVREESLTLYGFASDDERLVFDQVQSASGVGPRVALAMVSVHSPASLRQAVADEDTAALTRVPGIGKKGAQRIVLELKGKLDGPVGPTPGAGDGPEAGPVGGAAPWREQVVSGLVNLGWSQRDAEAASDAVSAELSDAEAANADVASLLKYALRRLSRA
ncbi:Holliday junction branch migration protein RuvA [Lipingzhangella sp. LS1_29]|uniref:Holliday junction branch migration complex subunit RuvA n=1 Tax=Lipingzhangella rawalii TaxID=2055835 RepID=A0ABU2H7Q8_9ACTN|nr:Holliday junction branch migration protein RuvA [Lipingzhangella rawalii]MDS1271323.1 Holliday junction branch migration protein RuvA [Lipingzhangella rawalii]